MTAVARDHGPLERDPIGWPRSQTFFAARRRQGDRPRWQPAGPSRGPVGTRRKPNGATRRSSPWRGTGRGGPRKRPAPPERVQHGRLQRPPASRQSRSEDREASASGSLRRSTRPVRTRPTRRRAMRPIVCDRPGTAIVAGAFRHPWTRTRARQQPAWIKRFPSLRVIFAQNLGAISSSWASLSQTAGWPQLRWAVFTG
jgi:hypothetical protein